MKNRIVALVGVLGVLSACSGINADGFGAVTPEHSAAVASPTTTVPPGPTSGEEDRNGEEVAGLPGARDRQVIYDAQVQLETGNTRSAFDRIIALVEGSGGFVAATSIGDTREREEQPTIFVTLRLPAENLTAVLTEIREVADRVVTESLQTQDVTDEFVDIEAQLRNLTALETELLVLLGELRDNRDADPSKLLQVFDQIKATRGEIEQLEGRRQLLENLVSMATIQVGISPLPAAAPIVPNDPAWEPAAEAKGALRDLVEALQGLAGGLIRAGLYVVPILGLVLGPIALVGRIAWKRVKRRATPTTAGSV